MSLNLLFANNASSRLYAPIDAITTSIRVQAGGGDKFPQPVGDGSNFFVVTVEDRRSGQIEIMHCTAKSGDILNVVRAKEDTAAQAFAMGATVSNRLTADTMYYLANAATATNVGTGAEVFAGADPDTGTMGFRRLRGTGIVITSTDANGLIINAPVPDWAAITNKPVTFPPTLPIPSSGVTGLDAKQAAQDAAIDLKEDKANKGVANGYASLDDGAKVPAAQLPSYVDDVLEYPSLAAFPVTGDAGVIYVALDTSKVYRWSGSAYVEISPSPGSTDAVPEGSTNLYFTNARASAAAPVQSVAGRTGAIFLNKNDVGLGNVDNTADVNKPVSTPTQTALNLKADLASPTFTGDPKAPTPATSDNDTSIATTAYVKAQGFVTSSGVTSVIGTAPVVSSGGTTPAISMSAATTSISGYLTSTDWNTFNGKANLASPIFTGDPQAPTPATTDNDTSIATTAFVKAQGYLPSSSYTAADVLAKLITVDGAGSSLDADLLDGQNGTYYTTLSNQTGTISSAQHGNLPGGALHALATSSVAGFIVDAPSDGEKYARSNGGWVRGGGASVIIADAAPSSPLPGTLWYESDSGNTFIWYEDPNSAQWVQVNVLPPMLPIPEPAIPPGQINWFATPTAPNGYLKANGAAVSRTTYAALFAAIGTTWGVGDGTTTFNLPDLRGEFTRSLDDGRGIDAGRTLGSSQAEAVATHTHGLTVSGTTGGESVDHAHYSSGTTSSPSVNHTHNYTRYGATRSDIKLGGTGGAVTDVWQGFFTGPTSGYDGPHTHTWGNWSGGISVGHTHAVTSTGTSDGGTGLGAETRPRNVALLACIKT